MSLPMADETPRVNRDFSGRHNEIKIGWLLEIMPHSAVRSVQELPRPHQKCTELVRIDQEIDDERYRGEHEKEVSHEPPCGGRHC